jgi:hypothetical protein
MVEGTSGIGVVLELLEVDFVVDDLLVLVRHVDRLPGQLHLRVADEGSVELGHRFGKFVNT